MSYREFILEARKSSPKSSDSKKRSKLLKIVMKSMSGDEGKAMADAIEAKDLDRFKNLWQSATNAIVSKLEADFKGGSKE